MGNHGCSKCGKPWVACHCPPLANAQATVEALQALVRALPMVRIELNGAYHDTLLAWPEDYAVKELLRYRASLDATTPATTKT